MKKLSSFLSVAVSIILISCGTEVRQEAVIPSTPAEVKIPEKPTSPGSGESSQKLPKTKMKFNESIHDFGKLKGGESREYDFEFTNVGKEDLVIEFAKGSCGCTVPEWPKEPIKPGAKGSIKVKFDSTGKKGKQEKTVTITANTDPDINSIITIKAEVEGEAYSEMAKEGKK